MICLDCLTLICEKCQKEDHKKHRYKSYTSSREDIIKVLEKTQSSLAEKRDQIQKITYEIENEKKIFQNFFEKILHFQNVKLNELSEQKETYIDLLERTKTNIEELEDTNNIDIKIFAEALSITSYKSNLDESEREVGSLGEKNIARVKECFKNIKDILNEEKEKPTPSFNIRNMSNSFYQKFFEKTVNYMNIKTLKGHNGQIYSVSVSPDNKNILTGSFDQTLKVWKAETGDLLKNLNGNKSSVWSSRYSKDGKYIFAGFRDGSIKVWETSSYSPIKILKGHKETIRNLDSTRKNLVSCSEDKTIKIWSLRDFTLVKTLIGHEKEIFSVAVSPSEMNIISGDSSGTLKIWDFDGTLENSFEYDCGSILCICCSRDSRYIIFGATDNLIRVVDSVNGKIINILKDHNDYITSVFCTFDEKFIISGSNDETIKIWKLKNGKLLQTLNGHTKGVESVVQSQDLSFIVSSSADFTIKIWK